MKLTDWLKQPREDNELLDVFLQITRLLKDGGDGAGFISPALYDVDNANNVSYLSEGVFSQAHADYRSPEAGKAGEKSDVFSLGMLLFYLLNGQTYYEKIGVSANAMLKSRRKNTDMSVIKAADNSTASLLMERMTSPSPESRPSLKDVLSALNSGVCRFSVCPKNVRTGEIYGEITRSFTGSADYKFKPESVYIFNSVTLAPISTAPLLIPFRLVKKQYALEVSYAKEGRWSFATKKPDAPTVPPASPKDASKVPNLRAALCYCDVMYDEMETVLLCGTDGVSFELGFAENGVLTVSKNGELSSPERIEARILSLMKQAGRPMSDIVKIAVYGELPPAIIRTINDIFPEEVGIYELTNDDILKGAALYLAREEVLGSEA